ncbi:recombinase family protein [Pleomorphochaeta sp. DL1XJH-081]|uniref:recombinase family protein n=1 Tax=Pleomorphochaeta sp. DL1XJH-081 TaxID=3409690 RepID=UPI003BB4B4E9
MPYVEKPKPTIRAIPRTKLPPQAFKRVALYCRVSSKMERQLDSLSAQMDIEKQDILDHPNWEYVDTYSDISSGRSIQTRPGFKRLMADCEAGKIDLIYTKSISRFGRNCVDFLVVLRRLKELGVDVYFHNEDVMLSSEAGELILTLHAALAQAESEDKSTNIKWGIKRSTTHPDSPAFSRTCYGYDRDEQKNLVINEHEADIVRRIFGWYVQGWSIVRIKKELEIIRIPSPKGKRRWPVSTIDDILSNEKYTGNSVYGLTVGSEYPAMKRVSNNPEEIQRSENHHPHIIERNTFDRVQQMKKSKTNIELDEHGNRIRKSTHYSMKQSDNKIEELVE